METPRTNVAVNELTFSLYQRHLHPELFTIYARRLLKTHSYEATIWVTGCSHVVTVYAKDSSLSEVISTPGQLLPDRFLIDRFQFQGQRTHQCKLSQGISYQTEFQVEKMSANLYKQSHTDIQKFARTRGVFVDFSHFDTDGLNPFSYIDYEARKNELNIHTFHAYPDQMTIIKTLSLFEIH
jgi:hypothetical protein